MSECKCKWRCKGIVLNEELADCKKHGGVE